MQDMVLKVPANSLSPGLYNFTLEVWRPGAADAGVGSWSLEVLAVEVPTVPLAQEAKLLAILLHRARRRSINFIIDE